MSALQHSLGPTGPACAMRSAGPRPAASPRRPTEPVSERAVRVCGLVWLVQETLGRLLALGGTSGRVAGSSVRVWTAPTAMSVQETSRRLLACGGTSDRVAGSLECGLMWLVQQTLGRLLALGGTSGRVAGSSVCGVNRKKWPQDACSLLVALVRATQ